MGKKINSLTLQATSVDSRNDVVSTIAVLAGCMAGYFLHVNIDGYVGLLVAVFILYSGVNIVKETISPLLGEQADEELVGKIKELVLSCEEVLNVHDLLIHDYGPGRRIASVHAEVPSDVDLVEIHDVIDNIEVQILEKTGILMCIHIDPIVLGDETVNRYKEMTREIIAELNDKYCFHDFRMVQGPTHTNLLFDLVVPAEERTLSDSEILAAVKEGFREKDSTINIVARVEHSFV